MTSPALQVIQGGKSSPGLVTKFGKLAVYLPDAPKLEKFLYVGKLDTGTPGEHKYGTVQIAIDSKSDLYFGLQGLRMIIPDDQLAGEGRDIKPHVTVRYGLTKDVGLPEYIPLKDYLNRFLPFDLRIGKVKSFPATKHSDGAVPVVLEVISPELLRLNGEIASVAAFKPSDFPEYIPHITVAYLKDSSPWVDKLVGISVLKGMEYRVNDVEVVLLNATPEQVQLGIGSVRDAGDITSNAADKPAMFTNFAQKIAKREIPGSQWVTIHGHHILLTQEGKIAVGPRAWQGKHYSEIGHEVKEVPKPEPSASWPPEEELSDWQLGQLTHLGPEERKQILRPRKVMEEFVEQLLKAAAAAAAPQGDGHWVTMSGVHVFIGSGGAIEKGPAGFIGKKPDELGGKTGPASAIKGPKRFHTDEQLTSKLHDDRLQASVYRQQRPDLQGLSVGDKFRYHELNAETPSELKLLRSGMELSQNVPAGLKGDALRAHLKEHRLAEDNNKAADPNDWENPKTTLGLYRYNPADILKDADPEEKQEFLDHFTAHLSNMHDKDSFVRETSATDLEKHFSTSQIEKLSDELETVAKEKNIGRVHQTGRLKGFMDGHSPVGGQANELWKYTQNYEMFRGNMFTAWAQERTSGAGQQAIRQSAAEAFSVNHGVQFYQGDKGLTFVGDEARPREEVPIKFSSRMTANMTKLKQESDDYYKTKLGTDDLASVPLELHRGVSGKPTSYTPSAAESWTTDRAVGVEFGKMMADQQKEAVGGKSPGYSVLTHQNNYSNVLWSTDYAAGKPGWPSDRKFLAYAEVVTLGGSINSVVIKRR